MMEFDMPFPHIIGCPKCDALRLHPCCGNPIDDGHTEECEGKTMVTTLSEAVFDVYKEYDRARAKHGPHAMDGAACTDLNRIAALAEEVGEVARCMTYDKEHAKELRKELIQVANIALSWASIL